MTGDSIVGKGKDFAISCNLNSKKATIRDTTYDVDSSMIKFRFKNAVVSDDRVEILNDTAAKVNIQASDFNDTGNYFCFLDVFKNEQNLTLVCASKLTVGCKLTFKKVIHFVTPD